MTPIRSRILRASFGLTAVLLVACGGGGSEEDAAPATTAIPRDAFVQQANAICARMNQQGEAIVKASPDDTIAYIRMLEDTARLLESTLRDLKALPQPPADARRLSSMYTDVQHLADLYRAIGASHIASDPTRAVRLQAEEKELRSKADASANALGLTECGKSGSVTATTTTAPAPPAG